jgi:hypothetical protein
MISSKHTLQLRVIALDFVQVDFACRTGKVMVTCLVKQGHDFHTILSKLRLSLVCRWDIGRFIEYT